MVLKGRTSWPYVPKKTPRFAFLRTDPVYKVDAPVRGMLSISTWQFMSATSDRSSLLKTERLRDTIKAELKAWEERKRSTDLQE
jgi:hypothetical protein